MKNIKGRINLFLSLCILSAILVLPWILSNTESLGTSELSDNVKFEGCVISSAGFMFSSNDLKGNIFYLDHQEVGVVNFLTISSSLDDFAQNELLCRWNFEVEWQGILKNNKVYYYSADFEKKIARIETGDSLFVRAILPSKFLVSLKAKTASRHHVNQFLSNMNFQDIPVDSSKIQ